MSRQTALPPMLAPRLIRRAAAAEYVGISPTKFDELVKHGRMPKPKCIDARRAWDVRALDIAVDELPNDGDQAHSNPWDEV